MARCTGLTYDIRLDSLNTYASYYGIDFKSYISHQGDSYDRYLLRMSEMYESLHIINQVLGKLFRKRTGNKVLLDGIPAYSATPYNSMEELIHHFKY